MKRRRIRILVCIGLMALLIVGLARMFRERYAQLDIVMDVDVMAKERSAYLTINLRHQMYRFSKLTQLRNWFFRWPVPDESFSKASLRIIEITDGHAVHDHIFLDFVAPGSLIPLEGEIYLEDRPTFYRDLLSRRNSPNYFKMYRWVEGEFMPISDRQQKDVAKQALRPLEKHYEAQGWTYLNKHTLEEAAESSTPIILSVGDEEVTIKLDKRTAESSPFDSWLDLEIRLGNEPVFTDRLPFRVVNKQANLRDWRAFIESGAHRAQ